MCSFLNMGDSLCNSLEIIQKQQQEDEKEMRNTPFKVCFNF